MEIKFENVSLKKRNKYVFKNINLKLKSSQITGIYHDDLKIIIEVLLKNKKITGDLLIDNLTIDNYNLNLISYIDKLSSNTFHTENINSEMSLLSFKSTLSKEEYLNRIIPSLNMVGLNENYLNRNINTLSKSEKRLLQFALNLIINPDIIIINEPFLFLDKKFISKIKKIILELKRKYHKTIIIYSEDINILYELCDNLICFHNNNVLIHEKTSIIFKDYDFLTNNNISVPDLVLFNQIAMQYDKKLTNTKDINDLVKEVYRYVSKNKEKT